MTKAKRLTRVYSYSAATGVEPHAVASSRTETIVVQCGISGMVMRRSELDEPDGYYFTSPVLAVEAFVAKAKAALADSSRAAGHAGWRKALGDAQEILCQIQAGARVMASEGSKT